MTRSVLILLATRNGERFLPAQLESIARQTLADWRIVAADDHSRDATRDILEDFAARHGRHRVVLRQGPGRGASENFLQLACAIEADDRCWYAFCDQDDIWREDKLARAGAWLERQESGCPALYCSRTRLIDAQARPLGHSAFLPRPPGFAHALVQNIASGNTMVFNAAALRLYQICGQDLTVPAHDWWLYLVVSACGGRVHWDAYPTVDYRQHGANTIGAGRGLMTRLGRLAVFLQGHHAVWSEAYRTALAHLHPWLTMENRKILADFDRARTSAGVLERCLAFRRSGVYRQATLEQIALYAGAALKRL